MANHGDATTPLRGAIVAMTRQRVIGLEGSLPWHYPEDLKRFKQCTLGHPIVMGRKTWQSIGSKPLPGRRNIVVSRRGISGEAECYPGVDAALDACGEEDAWVIGGGQVYRAAMPRLNLLDVTWVPDVIPPLGATTFPAIDRSSWRLQRECPLAGDDRLIHSIYVRVNEGATSWR
jgi:dihydrofolate reductase